MLTHRQSTRRRTHAWQLGAAACLAVAGMAIALPVERALNPRDQAKTEPVEAPTTRDIQAAIQSSDIRQATDILNKVVPRHEQEPVTVVVVPDKPQPPPPPPSAPEPVGVWNYIGAIITPTSRRALVKIDTQQHMLAEGDGVEQTKVVSIAPTELTIETAGERRTVQLAQRTMLWPTDPPKRPVAFRTPPVVPSPQPGGAMAGQPGMGMTTAPMAPSSFDQARQQQMIQAQQAAAAEMNRRAKEAQYPPHRPEEKGDGELNLEVAQKALADPGLNPDEGADILETAGIKPGTPVDETVRQLKERGMDPNDALMGAAKVLESRSSEQNGADERRKKREQKEKEKGG